jgi:hypothetical protein
MPRSEAIPIIMMGTDKLKLKIQERPLTWNQIRRSALFMASPEPLPSLVSTAEAIALIPLPYLPDIVYVAAKAEGRKAQRILGFATSYSRQRCNGVGYQHGGRFLCLSRLWRQVGIH